LGQKVGKPIRIRRRADRAVRLHYVWTILRTGRSAMARGINKVILIGHLGQDPEVRALPSGSSIANLRIATTESWKDKQSGEFKEQTEWHTVVLFGRTAEVAAEYLKKGSQVFIEGRL